MPDKDYTFVPDLLQEVAPPDKGMTSSVLHKDERFNITPIWICRRARAENPFSSHPGPDLRSRRRRRVRPG